MRVDKILTVKSINNVKNKVSKPIKNVVSKNIQNITVTVSVVSAMYAVNKTQESRQNKINSLKELNLNDETINKILNAKNKNNKPLFTNKNIEILKETANFGDKHFYTYIMQNIDGIDYLSKENENDDLKYEMHAKTKDGEEHSAQITFDFGAINVHICETKGDNLIYKKYNIDNDIIFETNTITTKDNKVLLKESIEYDTNRNLITRYINNNETPFVEHSKETSFSDNGVIKNIVYKTYDNSNYENITKKVLCKDYENNALIKANLGNMYDKMSSQKKEYKNPLTGKLETLEMSISNINGVYNSIITDEDGNSRIESRGIKNPDGSISVEKHFVSLDGTKTDYIYKSYPAKNDSLPYQILGQNGETLSTNKNTNKEHQNIEMSYRIMDKDGSILTQVNRTFKRVNPNIAYSSVNGHKYKIEKLKDSYSVTDYSTGKTTNIPNTEIFENKKSMKHSEVFDKLSGDMLLDFYDKGYKFRYTNDDVIKNSHTFPVDRIMQTKDNLAAFAHELGHIKDFSSQYELLPEEIETVDDINTEISSNSLFKETFEKERKAFEKSFSGLEQDYIQYFISKLKHHSGKHGAEKETVAEANALFSTDPGLSDDAVRDYYLQKFFPKTLAIASKLLMGNNIFHLNN